MELLQQIISYLAIAAAFLSSIFSWGSKEMKPFLNDYELPDTIPAYSVIPTDEKDDWTAKWIWDEESLTKTNTWMCLSKKVALDKAPSELTAHISADSKYWL